ncbi:MAG: hypothetical protein WBD13_14320 [Burkholderiaceae bacterium]
MSTETFTDGGYRYIPAVFQYSGGVVAEPGMRIERVSFSQVVPLAHGFELIEKHLAAIGRPNTAFCACELRSPAPFTEQGFRDFNAQYGEVLTRWGILRDGVNPIARSNVCPEINPPDEPGFHAFSYTVVDPDARPTFVVAGSAECPEGKGDYRDNVIARGDLSQAGLKTKVQWVLGEMQRRMGMLGFEWPSVTASQVYTVHDFHPYAGDELVRSGAMRSGVQWHFARPPVQELEFEMDCRGLPLERVHTV